MSAFWAHHAHMSRAGSNGLGVTPATNGEYIPDSPPRHALDVAAAALAHADDAARKAGMDRSNFKRVLRKYRTDVEPDADGDTSPERAAG